MTIRYQADNDLNKAIVRAVSRLEPGVDFRSAQSAALDAMTDFDVLRAAAADGRILVSHDFRTMPRHFLDFARSHRSPGVLLVSQDFPVGRTAELLVLLWSASEPADWAGRLSLLPSLVTAAYADPEAGT